MVESQAIARVNRMGQTRNVRVVRYIMEGTVEEVRELHANSRNWTDHRSWKCRHSRYGSLNMRRLVGKRMIVSKQDMVTLAELMEYVLEGVRGC